MGHYYHYIYLQSYQGKDSDDLDRNTAYKCTFLSFIDITNNIDDEVDDLKEATSEQEKETQMLVVVVFSGALHKSELMSSRT